MKTLIKFMGKQQLKHWFQLLLLIVAPCLLPFIFYGIIEGFAPSASNLKIQKSKITPLPQAKKIVYNGSMDNFIYFSYAPDTPKNAQIINDLIKLNKLQKVRVKSFSTPKEAEHYFNVKNIAFPAQSVYESNNYQDIFCEDLLTLFQMENQTEFCSFDFSGKYREHLMNYYNIYEDEFNQSVVGDIYTDDILFHINFVESTEKFTVSQIPMNITTEIVYNTSILDKTIAKYPDYLSQSFGNDFENPYWTGYGFTIQTQLDKLILKHYSDIDINYSGINRLPDIKIKIEIPASMFFEIVVILCWSMTLVLASYFASISNSSCYQILNRLGIKQWEYWLIQYLFVFLGTFVSCMIQGIVFHYFGVAPMSYVSLGFCLFEMFCLSLIISSTAVLLAVFFGQSSQRVVFVSCGLSVIFLLLPALLHMLLFQAKTFFDPSLIKQPITILFMSFFPIFNSMSILDSMTSQPASSYSYFKTLSNHTWKAVDKSEQIPFDYLFTDYRGYSSTQRQCLMFQKVINENLTVFCYFKQPRYGYLNLLGLFSSIILYPCFAVYFSYVVSQHSFRGLPLNYLFKKKFYQKPVIPELFNIEMRNVNVVFKKKLKNKKKCSCCRGELNHVLRNATFNATNNEIHAILGESGCGKSTILNFLTGELGHVPCQKLAKQGKYRDLRIGDFKAISDNDCYCKIGDFNLVDPIDAYNLKPFIGYCPQDYSNVWLNMTVHDNIYYSILFRSEYSNQNSLTQSQMENQIRELVSAVSLNDKYVMSRIASQLSGGMLRRLALCNAMAANPRILLLDEVSAGVDPLLKYQIRDLLVKSQAENKNLIILTSHDTQEIEKLSTCISILDNHNMKIDHVSLFDFINQIGGYYVKLYSTLNFLQNDFASLCRNFILDWGLDDDEIFYFTVTRHEISFYLKCTDLHIIKLSTYLANQAELYELKDIIISRPQLGIGYLQVVDLDYNSIDEQNDSKKVIKQYKLKKLTLFNKSFLIDLKGFFLFLIGSAIACLVLCILFAIVKPILDQIMASAMTEDIEKLRTAEYATGCLSQLAIEHDIPLYMLAFSLININELFINHKGFNGQGDNESLFRFKDSENPLISQCAAYASYLGLDLPVPHYVAIGDNRYQNIKDYNYQFSFVEHKYATKIKTYNHFVYNIMGKTNKLNYSEGSIKDPRSIISKYLFNESEFDPSFKKIVGKDDIGVLPFIKPKYFVLTDLNNNQQYNYNCQHKRDCENNCRLAQQSQYWCRENNDLSKCHENCSKLYLCDDENPQHDVMLLQVGKTVSSFKQFEKNYQQSLNNLEVTTNYDSSFLEDSILAAQTLAEYQQIMNFQFNNYNVKVGSNNQLLGQIDVDITTILPNRGKTSLSYTTNQGITRAGEHKYYDCNNTFEYYYYSKYKYTLPSQVRRKSFIESGNNIGTFSMQFQAAPSREHAVLFDTANEPITLLTSALLRKQIFQKEIVGDSSPWNFSYSLVGRAMPTLADTTVRASAGDLISILQLLVVAIFGMIPMIYVSNRFGDEHIKKISYLLRYHSISQNKWITFSILYSLTTIFILTTVNFIVISVLIPDIFYRTYIRNYNIIFFFLESFICIPSAIFWVVVSKSQKTVPIIATIGIFIMIIFTLIGFSSDIFSIVISIFLPTYAMIYQMQRGKDYQPPNILVILFGFLVAAVQISIVYFVQNWTDIVKYCKRIGIKIGVVHPSDQAQQSNQVADSTSQFLEISNVDFSYNKHAHALKGLSIQSQKSQVYGLLGSNGSGKSTLIHCLAGLYRPQVGQALLHSEKQGVVDLFKLPNPSKFFTIVPQMDIYWEQLSLKEHMRFFATAHNKNDESVIETIIGILNLTEFQDMSLATYSGGMKRRASIAFALAAAPEVLALDEPSCGLGIKTKQQVQEAIKYSMGTNSTIIITSHDMNEITQLVDKCCLMHEGLLVCQSDVSTMRNVHFNGLVLQIRCVKQIFDDLVSQNMSQISEWRDNKVLKVYEIVFTQNASIDFVIKLLNTYQQLNSFWNILGISMEDVFMKYVSQFKGSNALLFHNDSDKQAIKKKKQKRKTEIMV